MKVYQHIYNDNHELDQQFQTKIVMAYESFVGFCMAAVRYYSKGGLKRWLRAIWGSSMMLDDRASKVQEALVDVRYMSEELLNKNVDAVKRINIDQTRKIEGLEAQIRQLQQGHDYDRLERIRELIGQKTYSRETELDLFRKYQRDVQADFDTNWTNLERMQGPLLQNFKNGIIFQDWRQSQHSSLLIMAGYNNESVYSSGKCWLSPIALDTITQLNEADQPDPYAFYILGLRPDTEMVQQVLSCLIIQLLNQNRGALQNEAVYAELNAELREYAKLLEESQQTTALSHALRIKDIKKAINKAKAFIEELSNKANAILQKVALRVLNTFDPTKPVWIVLDRGDKCKAGAFNHRKKLAKSLVYLVENAKVNVKILAIVNGYDWRVDEMADELGQSKEESLNVHKMEQKRID